jgi:Flp pilus assembly pilin Flp
MLTIVKIVKSAIADRRGVTAMEYGLIAGVLAVGLALRLGARRRTARPTA